MVAADLVVYILYISHVAIDTLPFRIAPYLRVVFFILYIRHLRESLVVLVRMLGTYLEVLVLCLLFLLLSSWLAYVIFEHTQQGTTVFSSYPDTLYQLLVLFTTSNNPDVWIPAYNSSRWYSLFFVLFVLLGVYFLTNLVLAVVYESFQCGLAKQVSEKDQKKRRILQRAFDVIVHPPLDSLDKKQCIRLFKQLKGYRTLPDISEEEYGLIFNELDDNGDFKIVATEFIQLLNIIHIEFQKEESEPCLSRHPFYNSLYSEKLKGFVKSPKFKYVFVFVLLLNLAALIAETRLDIQNKSGHKSWQKVEFVFAWIYLFEVALRVYTHGLGNYLNKSNNWFNFIFTWVLVIGETITIVSSKELKFFSNQEWIRYLLIVRILRFIRLVMIVPRYHTFVDTFLHLIPGLMPYLGTIFCVMCIYCTLGVQIFGGLVNAGNSDLPSTDLADSNYLSFNFNDYPNGMVTLFNLIVLGSWQVWMKDYVTLTGTSWTYMYFISFYLITVLLLLNLIVAFVLQALFAEIDLKSSKEEEDGKQLSASGRRLKVDTKTSTQKFDNVIHKLLQENLKRSQPASA